MVHYARKLGQLLGRYSCWPLLFCNEFNPHLMRHAHLCINTKLLTLYVVSFWNVVDHVSPKSKDIFVSLLSWSFALLPSIGIRFLGKLLTIFLLSPWLLINIYTRALLSQRIAKCNAFHSDQIIIVLLFLRFTYSQ